MGRNTQKNTSHYEPSHRVLLDYDSPDPVERKRFMEMRIRAIAKDCKEAHIAGDLRDFRRKKNRTDDVRTLRKAHRALQRYAQPLFDDPENTTIRVMECKNERPQVEVWRKAQLIDYLASGPLNLAADIIEAYESPKGKAPKLAINLAVKEMANFYRTSLGKPDWETIGKIIKEEFPDTQRHDGNLSAWVRQIDKRWNGTGDLLLECGFKRRANK